MTLRRKLLTALGGLAALAFLAAGVAVYVTLRWQGTTEENRDHYLRSLALETVRADTFQALAEVNDALAGSPDDYVDARADFERALATTEADFEEWQRLANQISETAEVAEVRATYARLVADARRVFELLENGQRSEAVRLVDDELDTGDYAAFRAVTEKAAAADRAIREGITAETERLRQTALVMSALAMLAIFSLTLLIAAYLSQDLFRPLVALRRSLDDMADGADPKRLAVDRGDEFGKVAMSFNRAADSVADQLRSATDRPGDPADGGSTAPPNDPPGEGLHLWIARARSAVTALREAVPQPPTVELDEIDAAIDALARHAAIIDPLDLKIEPVDPRQIAQEALAALAPILATRGVSCECQLDPDAYEVPADSLKLRAVLDEALRHALSGLPDKGGRIGLRVHRDLKAARLMIDVADSGGGANPIVGSGEVEEDSAIAARPADTGRSAMRAVLMRHGGDLEIVGERGQGTVVRVALPLQN